MEKHIIYPTLAPKTMVGGVPRTYLLASIVLSMVATNLAGSLLVAPFLLIILWGGGWLYTKSDPDFADIYIAKKVKVRKSKTFTHIKGNRYLP